MQRLTLILEHTSSLVPDYWDSCRAVMSEVSPVQLVASVSSASDPPQHLYRGRQHLRACAWAEKLTPGRQNDALLQSAAEQVQGRAACPSRIGVQRGGRSSLQTYTSTHSREHHQSGCWICLQELNCNPYKEAKTVLWLCTVVQP